MLIVDRYQPVPLILEETRKFAVITTKKTSWQVVNSDGVF